MKCVKVPLLHLTFLTLITVCVTAQGAVTTYQGRLTDNNGPVNATVALEFRLYPTPAGGSALWTEQHGSIAISNGLFTVVLGQSNPLDGTLFDGSDRWLGISVNGGPELAPRSQLAATPYAIAARRVTGVIDSGSLAGTYANSLTFNNPANQFNGSFIGNGSGLSSVNAAFLGGRAATGFWQTGGNGGTTPGLHFVGTTDNRALEFRVNGLRALRLEPTGAFDAVNVIGGASLNAATPGAYGVTIGGGGLNDVGSIYGVVGGGSDNNIASGSQYSTIGGGLANDIGSSSFCSALGAGENNNIGFASPYGTIAGGVGNDIGSGSSSCTIAGGNDNNIGDGASFATIPGGRNNFAADSAFAAGTRAKARDSGAFVWGDGSPSDIASTNANSVTMRAAGGYRLFSESSASFGVYLPPGDSSWMVMSDRNAKTNFKPVDARAVLDKVAALPVSTWTYKSQPNGVRHIGPTAQDFKEAFDVGVSDTGISTVDADGVALAAIQGLNQKLEEKDAEIRELKERLTKLEQLLSR
jgi:trimeric autotransporter adhesin